MTLGRASSVTVCPPGLITTETGNPIDDGASENVPERLGPLMSAASEGSSGVGTLVTNGKGTGRPPDALVVEAGDPERRSVREGPVAANAGNKAVAEGTGTMVGKSADGRTSPVTSSVDEPIGTTSEGTTDSITGVASGIRVEASFETREDAVGAEPDSTAGDGLRDDNSVATGSLMGELFDVCGVA
jgi:hypothetical protein